MGMFDAKYIDAELEKIGARVPKPITIYLIGGCAMSFRGLKESTKDVDIVFRDRRSFDAFCEALFGAQYSEPLPLISGEYAHLDAAKMLENKDGFHLDLFVRRVCRKMILSASIVKRAEFHGKYGKMGVFLVAKEDIFLFKSLASEGRKRDLDDMRVIYPNLDWRAMLAELRMQKFSKEDLKHILRRFEEFRRIYELDVPMLGAVKRMAED